jgi:oligoribonuclease
MLLWIDLETTGLDPDSGEILEVGWFISDNWEILSEAKSAIVTPTRQTFDLMKQDLVVSSMHKDNGLAADLVLSENTRVVEDIEDEILADIQEYAEMFTIPVLAGSSVHFDRKWIEMYMPRLDWSLSHRHFDVSTLRMFFDDMGFFKLGQRDTPTEHRALPDVKDSYKLARKYVNLINMMVDEGDTDAERVAL